MDELFKDKKILITGGTGSIGRALTREILKHEPKAIRLFDIDETGEFEFRQELREYNNVRFLMGDIRDRARLRYAIEDIDIIFHMAALKHVESCEFNPFEAIKTNVLGTQNVIDVAIEEEVSKVIFTSSDKAVNPTNVMGTTKLLCERLVTAADYYAGARNISFFSVRFGNIIGSRGSVISLFKNQIQAGGPVTVTNPNMTRFIMPMSRALELLFKATQMAQRGEVFVLKMPAVKIRDLAEVMIEEFALSRRRTNEIKIEIIGDKPGEKMYEELMTEDEARRSLEIDDMFIILPEIKELSYDASSLRYPKIDKYPGAKPAKIASYKSSDAKLLMKHEIKKVLHKERLLD